MVALIETIDGHPVVGYRDGLPIVEVEHVGLRTGVIYRIPAPRIDEDLYDQCLRERALHGRDL